MSFVFTALSSPTKTLNCTKTSANAARQNCALNGLYDTCGVGFEFAQLPDVDAGADPADAGPGSPKYTVPFDISHYKAVTFWGMTTTPDPVTGSCTSRFSFPDTDTDPRGQVCNGGGGILRSATTATPAYFEFTTTWQQFTVTAGCRRWRRTRSRWHLHRSFLGLPGTRSGFPTAVYGINWQAQRNT
jgi:hypothetical protein